MTGQPVTSSLQLPRDGVLADYRPPAGVFDEMVAPDGTLRAPWGPFIGGVSRAGVDGLAQRADQVNRLLREGGVTYNIAGAPQGPDRPWELDPLPLLFDKCAWQPLADAVLQRATLLNLVLADVYGPQRLVREGVLPPALLFDHPGFLLPCHGIRPPEQAFLSLYAAHLARQPNGQWLVLTDRTRGPSGTGYTLENRLAVSRTLRHDFERLHIERLAPFFIALRERLVALAPGRRENPRVVLLSPGIGSPTFFEDGYMARYLGYTLVEGGDLTVRGTTVYLKTLGGLMPVDVILRRIPDDSCDPLELDPHSSFGTAGLVQALRAGEVVVTNAIGSGFLEAPALAAFLPAACRLLLGEDLRCQSVPTYWCGDPGALAHVEANLSQLIIRNAFIRRAATAPVAAGELTHDQRRQLIEQIRRRPEQFVAQEPVERSTAPVWNGFNVAAWRVELRTFAIAANDGFQLMPGGLARVFESQQAVGESMASGQSSKDVWILSDAPVAPVTLLKPSAKLVELRRSPADVPSRVADNLYWLGRHAERAEAMVRHLRSCIVRLTNDLEPAGVAEIFELVAALSDSTPAFPTPGEDDDAEVVEALRQEVILWLFDPQHPGALINTLDSLRDTASQVRDRLSIDGWRIVNQIHLSALFPWEPQPKRLGDLLLLLNQVLNLLAAMTGLGTESMTRGLGWRFLDMGRRVERALQTLRLFRRTLVGAAADPVAVLEALLEICDSSMTYRSRYRSTLQLGAVLDLLLSDDTNPRAVGYQLNALSEHVALLPRVAGQPGRSSEQEIMLAAQAAVRLTDVEALCQEEQDGHRARLESLLVQLEAQLWRLSEELTHHYLTHTGPAHQLRSIAAGRLQAQRDGRGPGMKYDVVHLTRYVYAEAVTLCHNQAHLTPRETARQKCLAGRLDIRPAPALVQPWVNAFGNTTTYFTIEQSHRELSVTAQCQVEVLAPALPPDRLRMAWDEAARRIASPAFPRQADPMTLMYRCDRLAQGEQVRDYAAPSFAAGRDQFDAVLELTGRIHEDFEYDPAATSISTTPTEILERRRGVCQDFAQLAIAGLRALGLLARYVSGYLVTRPPPGKPKLVGADATHAWVSVFFPEFGWVDFDPTNNKLADAEYITLAWGRDYVDVSPVRGVFIGGGAHQMSVSVDVAPVGD